MTTIIKIFFGFASFIFIAIALVGFLVAPEGEKTFAYIFLIIGAFVALMAIKYKGKKQKTEEDMVNEAFGEKSHMKELYFEAKERHEENKKIAILNYSPARAERDVLFYFQALQRLNDLYAPSKTKQTVNSINSTFESLNYVRDQPGFKEAFKEGYNTFILTTKVSLKDKTLDQLKSLDGDFLHDFINDCIVKQATQIINQNNILLEKYKDNPKKASERYQVVSESMRTLLNYINYSADKKEAYNFIKQHEVRARDRAEGLNRINIK